MALLFAVRNTIRTTVAQSSSFPKMNYISRSHLTMFPEPNIEKEVKLGDVPPEWSLSL